MRKLVLSTAVALSLASPSIAYAQGDLAPPPSLPPQPGAPQPGSPQQPAPRNATEADLKEGEKEDSGLGLEWVYLNADAGFSYIDLKGFSQSQLALTDTKYSGASYGFAAGVRLLFLTLGLRAQNHTSLNLWQINADVGMHLRISRLDGYLAIRGGYDTVGSLNQSVNVAAAGGTTLPSSGVDVHGWNVGLAFGVDYYLAHLFSIGAEASGDILFLQRPQPPLPPIPTTGPGGVALTQQQKTDISTQLQSNPLYQNSGSSVGFGGALTGHVAIHF